MPANLLDPGNERIRDIISLPDDRLTLINFGIIDDGATSLDFQFDGTTILSLQSDGDLVFEKDVTLNGTLTFDNSGSGADPTLFSNSDNKTLTINDNILVPGNVETPLLILRPLSDNIPAVFETNFTQTVIVAAEIFLAGFAGIDDLPQALDYAEMLVTQDVVTTGAHKGSMAFSVATGDGGVTSLLKLDGVGNGTIPQVQVNAELVIGLNSIQFDNEDIFIHELGSDESLELHAGSGKQVRIVLGPLAEEEFTYQFGATNANWSTQGLVNMGILSFGLDQVSIQRGDSGAGGNDNSLELDANNTGEIVLRIFDTVDVEEYNFSATVADFHDNQLQNAIMTASVTGVSAITGLGTQTQFLNMGSNFITAVVEIAFLGSPNNILAITKTTTNDTLRINGNTGIELVADATISLSLGSSTYDFQIGQADWKENKLLNLGILQYQPTTTTLLSNELLSTNTFTRVKAESGVIDTLSTITSTGVPVGQILIITPSVLDTITVTDTGNIDLINDRDYVMVESTREHFMALIHDNDNSWHELFRTEDHINEIIGDPTKGMSAVTVDGVTSLIITETLISGQVAAVPLASNDFLFDTGTVLRKGKFSDLTFSIIGGHGNDDTIAGTRKFFAFFANGNGNVDDPPTNKQFPLNRKLQLTKLAVRVGNNLRDEDTLIGIAIDGVLTALTVNVPSGQQNNTFKSTTVEIEVAANEQISLVVEGAPSNNNNLHLLGFSCVVLQQGTP